MDAVEHELSALGRKARGMSQDIARQVHPELDAAAYGLLMRLSETGPCRASELADFFGIGKGTMSRQLKDLEALGLVQKEKDPADGRASLLELTDEGRRRYDRARHCRSVEFRRLLGAWEQRDLHELARLLHQLNDLPARTAAEET